MFPLLFPYGLARIHEQAKLLLGENDIRQLIYLHCTGAWGEHISTQVRRQNVQAVEARNGPIQSLHIVNNVVFCVVTYLDVAPSMISRPVPNYVEVDSDREKWTGSPFSKHNQTHISIALKEEIIRGGLPA